MLKLVFRVVLGGLITFSGVACSQDNASSKQRGLEPPPATIKQLSAMEIGAMFERPTSVPQLLQNLKLAMDKDLLLQRAFFDDANLKKFFNGTKVALEKPDPVGSPYDTKNTHRAEVTIDSHVFPKMTAKLIYDLDRYVPRSKRVSGHIQLQMEAVPGFTLREVQNVFGANAQYLDGDYTTHAVNYTPTSKGSFTYEIRGQLIGKHKTRDPFFQKRAAFEIRMDAPPDPSLPGLRKPVTQDDFIKSIGLDENIEWPSFE